MGHERNLRQEARGPRLAFGKTRYRNHRDRQCLFADVMDVERVAAGSEMDRLKTVVMDRSRFPTPEVVLRSACVMQHPGGCCSQFEAGRNWEPEGSQ